MTGDRRATILARLSDDDDPAFSTKRLCEVCAEVTAMTGAGIMLMSGEIARGSACSTNKVSRLIEDLQFALGEGPCVDAYRQDRPVLEPDLTDPREPRWPAFCGPVLAAGARAVFGFPIRVGAVRLGALNLYRDEPGPLVVDQHADALVMASVAAEAILGIQADAAPGQLADELAAGADFKFVVHQASGMVAAQLDITAAQALIRLRGYAFGNERSLAEVAEDVVARTLRFDAGDDERPRST